MSNAPVPTPAASPTSPGSILAGKYRVERILGQGGMGVVVEARHIALDERVALKFLLPEFAQHPDACARFLREARNAVKIKSEHVARVSDVGTLDTGAPYMVMEYLEGRDLAGTLEKTGVLSITDAVDFIIQGSEAIAEAHSYGIVHRDLKPANLFLSKRPDGSPIVKVLDFGISKGGGGPVENLTKTTAAMGSALYMSPEQMQQTRSVDHRTDIYALGISLYELLAGKQPFYADTLPQLIGAILTGIPTPIRELRPDLPQPFADVVQRAYARERADRFQSVGEFVVALAPWAPSRSAPVIERVARMSGLPVPELQAGSSGVFASPALSQSASGVFAPPSQQAPLAQSSGGFAPPSQQAPLAQSSGGFAPPSQQAPLAQSSGGFAPASQQGFPPPGSTEIAPAGMLAQAHQAPSNLLGTRPTVPLPVMDPTAGAPPPPPPQNPNQIVPGHYSGPMSVRAAATFKQGAGAPPAILGQPSSKGGLIAIVAIAILGLAGIGGAMVMRSKKQPPPTVADSATAPVVTAPVTTTAVSTPPPSPSPPPPPTSSSAAPTTSSDKPAEGPPGKVRGGPLPSARATATAQPDRRNDGTRPPQAPDLGKMY